MNGPLTARQLVLIIAGCAVIALCVATMWPTYVAYRDRPTDAQIQAEFERRQQAARKTLAETAHYGRD